MRIVPLTLACCLTTVLVLAQEHHSSSATKPVSLMTGIGRHHHAITTGNLEAQKFFDQGLTLVYGFNHDEAIRSFEQAATLDPRAPMPHWGIGYALGPNINLPVDPAREKAAYDAVQKAVSLAANGSEAERGYIKALARRYSDDPQADLAKLDRDFKDAMHELMTRYPDDLDAATLYAESMMDLRPWRMWTLDGTPAEGTLEILAILESVLRRDPSHVGANHYYIHAVEASPHPEWGLPSAARLGTLVPVAGHLVHMPAHIYMRTGDYGAAAASNEAAAETDRKFIQATGVQGMYPLMYFSHNLHFLSAAYAMQGRFADAKGAADQLVENIAPALKDVPMVEAFMPTPSFVLLRFQRWTEILTLPTPKPEQTFSTAVWHFARGVALAATGDPKGAERDRQALAAVRQATPDEMVIGLNKAAAVFEVADETLAARIDWAAGNKAGAIEHWKKAVAAQDALAYDEPADWYYPVRESLGAALFLAGRPAEAEQIFRADLERTPRNGRSLFGLWQSLRTQGKISDAESVQRLFEEAWKLADVKLRMEDL